ncbi:MAG: hypothetical protein ABSG19_13130 [Candidatus Aminicenantales bacterium]
MKRAWTAAAILFLWTASFALEIKVLGPGDRSDGTKFRKPLSRVAPYALVKGALPDFLKQAGLAFFSSIRTARFNLLEDRKRNDFTRTVGGGVRLDAARRLTVFMEVRYFTGLVNLARAGLAHVDFSNLKAHPMGLQAGFRYLLSADQR